MPIPDIIAIDGPAAAGKSTVGERVAAELGYLYFDTGIMYRATTWAALQRGLDIADEPAITALAQRAHIDVLQPTVSDGRQYTVHVDGQDVTWDLRQPEVEAHVSAVSAYPEVRAALSGRQRRLGLRGRGVMVGRDIGTVVLSEAPLKVYLDATVEARARRRYRENKARGERVRYADILSAMRERDRIDSQRKAAPLKAADDAVVIDTTKLVVEQVVEQVLHLIRERSE